MYTLIIISLSTAFIALSSALFILDGYSHAFNEEVTKEEMDLCFLKNNDLFPICPQSKNYIIRCPCSKEFNPTPYKISFYISMMFLLNLSIIYIR